MSEKCTACPINLVSRVNCVPGRGVTPAEVMFIGMGLNKEDEMVNDIFMGPAGKMFETHMNRAGLSEHTNYLANIIKCRARDTKHHWKNDNRELTAEEANICGNLYLLEEIKRVQPKLIVTLGTLPLDFVAGKKMGIESSRGMPFWSERFNCNVLPTYHPSMIIRRPAYEPLLVSDLQRAKRILTNTDTDWRTEVSYVYATTPELVDWLMQRLQEVDEFALDSETISYEFVNGKIGCLSFSWKEKTAVVLPFLHRVNVKPEETERIERSAKFVEESNSDLAAKMRGIAEKYTKGMTVLQGARERLQKDQARMDATKEDALFLRLPEAIPEDAPPDFKPKLIRTKVDRHEVYNYYAKAFSDLDVKEKALSMTQPFVVEEFWGAEGNKKIWERLKPIFEDANKRKILANASFDSLQIRGYGIKLRGVTFDVLLAAHLIDPEMEKNLKIQAWLYTNMGGYDNELDAYNKANKIESYLEIPSDTLWPYSAMDADATFRVKQKQIKILKSEDLFWLLENVALPLQDALMETSWEGVNFDVEYAAQLGDKLTTQLNILLDEIRKEAGYAVNPASTQQLRDLLFTRLGLKPVPGKTGKTGPSVDKEVLAELAKQHPIPAKIQEYSKLSHAKSTYVIGYAKRADKNHRLHPDYIVNGTATGRLATQNPNTQNIPRKGGFKEMFKAPPGHKLVYADASQMELRVLAYYSRDPVLMKAFTEGRDVHSENASHMLGKPAEQVTEEERVKVKACVFGLIYGMTEHGLADELKCSEKEAKDFMEFFFAKFPNIQKYVQEQITKMNALGYVENLFGRKRRFHGIENLDFWQMGSLEREAINTPIQGGASDIISLATISLHPYAMQLGARMWFTIHDALMYCVPETRVAQWAYLQKVAMERQPQLPDGSMFDIPLKADFEIGERWGEFKKVAGEELTQLIAPYTKQEALI